MPARKESRSSVELLSPVCFHCGDDCQTETISFDNKFFCCEGCKLVFEILHENNLTNYYCLNRAPGSKDNRNNSCSRFDYLDDDKIKQKLITFTDGTITNITFLVPQIHCSSCIWLLENLYRLDKGVKRSTVNFLKREVHIVFNESETSIRKLTELLDKIGYNPQISLESEFNKNKTASSNGNYYKLGIAFFCFGNIMLFSFPEYFGLDDVIDPSFTNLFGYLNILLSLPVLLYADTEFFKSAINGIRHRSLNMDFPIALGIVMMYSRSLYEILSGTGAGYMDTFAALIFFMLAGRLFQNKTFDRLSFERDYKSYFPVAVTLLKNGKETSLAVSDLQKGDKILIRNEELIPADAILTRGNGNIDYSFVTGENIPVVKNPGDKIYAGGKQTGSSIELEVISKVSQSRLTQLWNESNYGNKNTDKHKSITDSIGRYFTIVVILIAAFGAIYYLHSGNTPKALNVFTAVLIITCPCALALSYPFALGNSIRILGNRGFYLKNTGIIERLSRINTIVFDKTGTLTKSGSGFIQYEGTPMTTAELESVFSLASQSGHPLSRLLCNFLSSKTKVNVRDYVEMPGAGLSGAMNEIPVKIGSSSFIKLDSVNTDSSLNTSVHVSIDNKYKGFFRISGKYREGLKEMLDELSHSYELHLISGDNTSEKVHLQALFGNNASMHFRQSPSDKLEFVKMLQSKNRKVLMAGDGLNDAGALKESYAGVAVSDNINNFSPACDAILDASSFHKLPSFLRFTKRSMTIIYFSYIISFIYNVIGIWFAISGNLSPVIAAVIMPLSTVTIILFTTVSGNLASYRI